MHSFIKKITTVSLILIIIILSFTGCGQITKETTSLDNENTSSSNSSDTSTLDDKAVIAGFSGLLKEYVVTLEADRPTTKTDETSIDSSVFKTSSFSASNTYLYWNYATGKNNVGNLTEDITARYRHYDKRTGLPFEKMEENFNYADVSNIDYTEREISFTGFYPEYPNKKIYKITSSEKIVKDTVNKNIFTFSLFSGAGAMEYIGVNWDTLKITRRDIIWNNASQKASGTMEIQGTAYPQFKGIFDLNIDKNNGSHYSAELFMSDKKMVSISICGSSDHAETHYYIGNNYFYQDLTGLNGGIEDFSTIEFQESNNYYDQPTIDGTANLAIGPSLKNLTLTAKDNANPIYRKAVTIKNVENLTVEKISFKKKLIIVNCKNVIINGINYGDISYRSFSI